MDGVAGFLRWWIRRPVLWCPFALSLVAFVLSVLALLGVAR
jgi:hypothetical protein